MDEIVVDTKGEGAQSMCERSMSALAQALNDVRAFGAVGQLRVDEVERIYREAAAYLAGYGALLGVC